MRTRGNTILRISRYDTEYLTTKSSTPDTPTLPTTNPNEIEGFENLSGFLKGLIRIEDNGIPIDLEGGLKSL